jgi:tetratricopeptide (TPR) repeat protein
MDKATLKKQLREITIARDDSRLHELVKNLSADDLQQYKKQLAEAFLDIYSEWQYDFMCDKVVMNEGVDSFFSYLLELLAEADKIDPAHINYEQRAFCYQTLAEGKNNQEEQLRYIEKAAQEIQEALKTQSDSSELNDQFVNILLNKIKISDQYKDEEFAVALTYFERALLSYTSSNQLNLVFKCFDILDMTFPRNQYWHGVFLDKLNAVLHVRAEKDLLIYLEWVNALKRIVENYDSISPDYAQDLTKQSVNLLNRLTNFETANQETLNKLGAAFSKTAEKLSKVGAIAEALDHYEVAVKYFIKAQDINPAAWTYPVYATNALKAMAAIFHAQHNKTTVIALFERGQNIFLKIHEPEKDFTANIYWGEFLIDYARLAHDFDSLAILKKAEEKLLIAQELGQRFYDHPYIALAKVALKLGDREKCLAILKECKAVFSHEYAIYSLNKVIEDEDFALVKLEIIAIHNN